MEQDNERAAGESRGGSGSGRDKSDPKGKQGALTISTANLSSHYCNVTLTNSTREEAVISFGVNQNWDRSRDDLTVTLLHRVILSPQHAKRLHQSLSATMAEYEKRHEPIQA